MQAEFLSEAAAAVETAAQWLREWKNPAKPLTATDLMDTGRYLEAIGDALAALQRAGDAIERAIALADVMLEPIVDKRAAPDANADAGEEG